MLSQELGLSRANLYRKLKAVTELSPTELIRNKRLEIAAKLLLESSYTVSEISVYTASIVMLISPTASSHFMAIHLQSGTKA